MSVTLRKLSIYCTLWLMAAPRSPGAGLGESRSMTLPPDPVTRQELEGEISIKMTRVQDFLRARHLGGILLSRVNNFAWITAGIADNDIVITSEVGAASLLIMNDGRKYIIGESGEVSRHMNEDLAGLGYEARAYDWYEDQVVPDRKLEIIHELSQGKPMATDVPYGDLQMLAPEFAQLRYQLTEPEIKKYRWVGRQATSAVAAVCRELHPGVSEKQIAVMAANELMRRGLVPTVLLMGVDQRVSEYYHHTPTDLQLKRYAIVNVCARRWGVVASVARFVHFGPLEPELKRRLQAAMRISAHYQASSKPGLTAGDIIEQAKRWFADEGFSSDWKRHHQGGAIGYAEREWIAVPGSKEPILDHEAFAWNPIIRGTLSFDTILVYSDHVENLTHTPDWPSTRVAIEGRSYEMPDILIRPER
ncbi:MAG: M24 family metallopeptidase [Acidobacteria bacterium]|nr:M24 family metallopeptidase [Acidobacteriota bacterium]